MMQHAGDKLLWGKGIYFAEKAAYSNVDKYVYQVRFFLRAKHYGPVW